jgi:histone-lysine N-methyltransferase SETMAR
MEASVKTHCPKQSLKGITIHWDNTPSQTAKVRIAQISELGMNQMSHPPYSPDIMPSDFFHFDYLKHKLQRCSYDSADELFSASTDLMDNLERSFLRKGLSRNFLTPLYDRLPSS